MVPWDLTAKESDFWRMEGLSQYYDHRADECVRASIRAQLSGLPAKYPVIRVIIDAFLKRHAAGQGRFLTVLREGLASSPPAGDLA